MKHVNVVCAVIKNDNNEVFVCERGPGRALAGKWEFPGGKIEEGESIDQTIVREIKEELSSLVMPIKYLGVTNHEYTDLEKPFSITMYAVECKLIEGNLTLSEHIDSKWVKVSDLKLIDFADADKPIIDLIQLSN